MWAVTFLSDKFDRAVRRFLKGRAKIVSDPGKTGTITFKRPTAGLAAAPGFYF
jgi:hypothetical protein